MYGTPIFGMAFHSLDEGGGRVKNPQEWRAFDSVREGLMVCGRRKLGLASGRAQRPLTHLEVCSSRVPVG